MHGVVTAQSSGEHQKACYRLMVFAILALFGPPAFGIPSGLFTLLYGGLLLGYAAWALRLTVLFHDEDQLGYLLTLFDIALTAPLVVWGREPSMVGPLVLLWVGGLSASAVMQRRRRLARIRPAQDGVDPGTGFRTGARLAREIESASSRVARGGEEYGLVVLRVQRYAELVALYGADFSQRALQTLARRVLYSHRSTTTFRTREDELVFLLEDVHHTDLADLASAVGHACSRLVDGRRIDVSVGYAACPLDGYDAAELLRAAGLSGRGGRFRAAPQTDIVLPSPVAVG